MPLRRRPAAAARGGLALALALVAFVAHPGSARGQDPATSREASFPENGNPKPDKPSDPPDLHPAEPSHSLGGDLRQLVSSESALVLGVGGALAFAVASRDHELSRRLTASAASDRIFEAGDILGEGWVLGGTAVSTYVAVSRVQEKKHFPSNVVFGAALGVAVGRAVTAAHGRRGVTLEPIGGPDGGLGLAVRVAW